MSGFIRQLTAVRPRGGNPSEAPAKAKIDLPSPGMNGERWGCSVPRRAAPNSRSPPTTTQLIPRDEPSVRADHKSPPPGEQAVDDLEYHAGERVDGQGIGAVLYPDIAIGQRLQAVLLVVVDPIGLLLPIGARIVLTVIPALILPARRGHVPDVVLAGRIRAHSRAAVEILAILRPERRALTRTISVPVEALELSLLPGLILSLLLLLLLLRLFCFCWFSCCCCSACSDAASGAAPFWACFCCWAFCCCCNSACFCCCCFSLPAAVWLLLLLVLLLLLLLSLLLLVIGRLIAVLLLLLLRLLLLFRLLLLLHLLLLAGSRGLPCSAKPCCGAEEPTETGPRRPRLPSWRVDGSSLPCLAHFMTLFLRAAGQARNAGRGTYME